VETSGPDAILREADVDSMMYSFVGRVSIRRFPRTVDMKVMKVLRLEDSDGCRNDQYDSVDRTTSSIACYGDGRCEERTRDIQVRHFLLCFSADGEVMEALKEVSQFKPTCRSAIKMHDFISKSEACTEMYDSDDSLWTTQLLGDDCAF
jgi:hypothetical protein